MNRKAVLPIVAFILAVVLGVTIQEAGATDFNVKYSTDCPEGPQWYANVVLQSTWDGTMTVYIDHVSGPTPVELTPFEEQTVKLPVSKDKPGYYVSLSPTDHLTGAPTNTYTRPGGCDMPTPPTTTNVCPPGQHPDGSVPPADGRLPCAVDVPIPPASAPVPEACPAEQPIRLEDGSCVTEGFGAPPDQSVPADTTPPPTQASAPVTPTSINRAPVPLNLPPTGPLLVPLAGMLGALLLFIGLVALCTSIRRPQRQPHLQVEKVTPRLDGYHRILPGRRGRS